MNGGFEITVAAGIAAAGLPLAVVNPAQVRAFARATGRLAKTDRLDAAVIAHFAEAVRPEPRPLASEAAQGLAELVARRRQLVEMIGMETNRRRTARNPKVLKGIARTLTALEAAPAAIDREIDDEVRGSPAWRAAEDLLTSVPGIGPVTAAMRKLLTILNAILRDENHGRTLDARHSHSDAALAAPLSSAEEIVERGHDLGHALVREVIVDRLALAPRRHRARLAQAGEVLG